MLKIIKTIPRILPRLNGLLKSLDQLQSCEFSAMFGSFHCFPYMVLSKRKGAIYRNQTACKGITDIKKTCKLYIIFSFSNVILKGTKVNSEVCMPG